MRQKFELWIYLFAGIAMTAITMPVLAQNAPAVSVDDQIKAQYTMVKLGSDSGGLAVIEAGTVLVIQKGGILGVPPSSGILVTSKYEGGALHAPGKFMQGMVKESRFMTIGEKVYPVKLDVHLDKDKISLMIIECDSCNGVQQPSSYKSEVVFEFPKGTLKTMSVPQIEDTLSQVFAFDQSGGGDQQNQAGQNQGNGQSNAQPVAQNQAQPASPPTIQMGDTIDQVQTALGQPEKIVNLGAKQIYIYKDMKITFVNGKVSDVQ